MQKNKAIYMWGAVTAVAVALAVFDYQWERHQEEQKAQGARLLNLEPSQVSAVELVLPNPSSVTVDSVTSMTNKLRFERKSDGWWIQSPVQERAAQDVIQAFVEGVLLETAVPVVVDQASVEWKNFGLDEPTGSVSLIDSAGQSSTIQVGSRKNFQGESYLRRNEENQVRLGAATWTDKMAHSLFDFRDKRALREPAMNVQGIRFQQGPRTLSFDRQDAKWSLREHPTWKLDQNQTREVLATLTGNLIGEFKREGQLKAADLKEFGLDKPALRIDIQLEGRDRPWTAEMSSLTGQNYFLQLHEPSVIAAVGSAQGARLVNIDPQSLRDRQHPFDFDPTRVSEVEIRLGERSKKAKPEEVAPLLKKLRDLEVAEFPKPEAPSSASGSKESVILRDAKGATLFSLSLSEVQKKKVDGEEKNVVLATSNLFPEVVSIEEDKAKELDLKALMEGSAQ